MSSKIFMVAGVFALGVALYAFCHSRPVNPVDQNSVIISLQKEMLNQLEMQTDILVAMRADSLSEQE